MFLRDGRSLMECFHPSEFSGGIRKENSIRRRSTSKGKCKSPKDKSKSDDGNDNICQICGDGGQLMLCDSCPSAFHCKCLHLDEVPEGDWHCSRCRCGSCGLGKSLNTGEPSSTMVSCMQCRIPYHRSCVSRPMDGNDSSWFCTKICQTIFGKLRKIVGQVFALDKGLSWTLVRFPEGSSDAPECENFKDKFSEALKLMQQSFDPVIDQETGMDVLSQLVYNRGSHVKRLDCSGFYTLMLMKEEQLVAVASIRPHGKILAEMPFIATSYEFRQQGMCKALMQALEFMLCGVGIYKLVIPSINEVVDIWTGSFGFRIMSNEDCKKFSGMNFLLFPGTTLLSKSLLGIGPRTRSETCSESKAQGRSVIQVKEQMVTSSKASLSRSRPIACH
ncbi:hypothetical protein KP509_02G052300 [Ceratopteris richardii]|nr:hypothetical protein KP509_02G052300 [Ceratopteris richardii]